MFSAKYKAKNVIDQQQARDLNPEIQDTVMYTFEVKVLMSKYDLEKVCDDSGFNYGESDAYVSNWFRFLFMRDQNLRTTRHQLTRKD